MNHSETIWSSAFGCVGCCAGWLGGAIIGGNRPNFEFAGNPGYEGGGLLGAAIGLSVGSSIGVHWVGKKRGKSGSLPLTILSSASVSILTAIVMPETSVFVLTGIMTSMLVFEKTCKNDSTGSHLSKND